MHSDEKVLVSNYRKKAHKENDIMKKNRELKTACYLLLSLETNQAINLFKTVDEDKLNWVVEGLLDFERSNIAIPNSYFKYGFIDLKKIDHLNKSREAIIVDEQGGISVANAELVNRVVELLSTLPIETVMGIKSDLESISSYYRRIINHVVNRIDM